MTAVISLMLAVADTPAAIAWYRQALKASVLWDMGSVAGLEIAGAPFFLHPPKPGQFENPQTLGTSTVRVELFVADPDAVIAGAVAAGASGGDIRDYEAPWGTHRQGSFTDPFGYEWHVGDTSPLKAFG